MVGIATDILASMPTPDTLRVLRPLQPDPYTGTACVGCKHRVVRRCLHLMYSSFRRNEEEPQFLPQRTEPGVLIGRRVDIDLGVERRANGTGVAKLLQLPHYVRTQLDERRPVEVIGASFRNVVPGLK